MLTSLQREPVDLLHVWRGLRRSSGHAADGRGQLVELALRLFSILPNTGDSERLFSVKGLVHTKLRNRLDPQRTHKTVLVRNDINQSHRDSGRIPPRLKRQIGLHEDLRHVSEDYDDTGAGSGVNTEEGGRASSSPGSAFTSVSAGLARQAVEDESSDTDNLSEPHHEENESNTADNTVQNGMTARQRAAAHRQAMREGLTLAKLFLYPAVEPGTEPKDKLAFYWRGGIDSLDDEMSVYDLIFNPTTHNVPMTGL